MSIKVGLVGKELAKGTKWYAYSGVHVGDISVPASITLIQETQTLRNSYVQITPFFGQPVSSAALMQLGIEVQIDGITVIKNQPDSSTNNVSEASTTWGLFVPRQSTLTVLSLNTSANNTQERGVNVLGWFT